MLENILIAVGIGALVASIGYGIYRFCKLEKNKRIAVVKEWLLLAVVEAEKFLGEGTGKLKLRYVYDMFIDKFKVMALIITFEQFSLLVDEALEEMREILSNNQKIKEYVEGGNDVK